MTAYSPQWWSTGAEPAEISIRSQAASGGAVYLTMTGLQPNQTCIAWFDLQVYGSPTGCSITLGATGNPAHTVVGHQSTGGQRVSVAIGLTANTSGQATAYMVPTLTGHGASWFNTTVCAA